MRTKENGITLIVLVVTIVLTLILASLGITIGTSTLDSAAFIQFRSELKIMQDKVNELNQQNKIDIEQVLQDLTDDQKSIFNITEISNIIFDGKNNEEIQRGFKYIAKDDINTEFGLDSVIRDYIINIEYRYVIFPDGFEYKGTKYYMIDQIEGEIYNVRYHDKNEKTGSFDVTVTREINKCKVEITKIDYNGYVNKWQVKYQLEGNSYWETSDDLTFYIKKEGIYNIKLIHGDEIDLGEQKVRILYDGLISNKVKNEVIKVGDYVQYTPAEVTTTDETYTNLISELGTYSGSTENTIETLTQGSLNWRVLDVVNGKVRLISEVPTTSEITLYGAKGYNNAVYLLDKTCSTLYNNPTYAEEVQNLKIENIQKFLTYDYTQYENSNVDTGKYGGTKTYTEDNYRYYPNLFSKEKTGWVDEIPGEELSLSKQTSPLDEVSTQAETSIKITQTYWYKLMTESCFTKLIYYNLFIAKKNEDDTYSNYSKYWMSSRCVNADSETDSAYFNVYDVNGGYVNASGLYSSSDDANSDSYALRPVITLKSNVQIDTTDIERDGTTPTKAYVLK